MIEELLIAVADTPVGDSATATPLEILYFHFSFTKMKKYGLSYLEKASKTVFSP